MFFKKEDKFDVWDLNPARDIATSIACNVTGDSALLFRPNGVGHCLEIVPTTRPHSDLLRRRGLQNVWLARAAKARLEAQLARI